jgi:hypothetical protein
VKIIRRKRVPAVSLGMTSLVEPLNRACLPWESGLVLGGVER